MWLPWLAAVAATAAVVAWHERDSLRAWSAASHGRAAADATAMAHGRTGEERPVLGVGLVAVLIATVLVLVLSAPAIEVAAIGVAAAAIRLAQRRATTAQVREVLGLPALALAALTLTRSI